MEETKKKKLIIHKKVKVRPPAELFEEEEAAIAGEDIILQYEYKGKVFYKAKVRV